MLRKIISTLMIVLFLLLCAGCQPITRKNDSSVDLPVKHESFPADNQLVVAQVPVTGKVTALPCPGSTEDVAKMVHLGESLYSSYCVACHGRQGQGSPNGTFPPLAGGMLAKAKNIQPAVTVMMNTDIHPMASLLFERGGLALIAYVRASFGDNSIDFCPGELNLEINP